MTPERVLELLGYLGKAFDLGEQLVELARQRHPELRVPAPSERDAIDARIDAQNKEP